LISNSYTKHTAQHSHTIVETPTWFGALVHDLQGAPLSKKHLKHTNTVFKLFVKDSKGTKKVKQSHYRPEAWTGPEGSRSSKLPDF
jgi:hypothetical protein